MAQPPVLKSSQPHSVSLPEGSSVATRKPVRKPADKEPKAEAVRRASRGTGSVQDDPVHIPASIARDPDDSQPLTRLVQAAPAPVSAPVMSDAIARRLEELRRRNDSLRVTLARQNPAARGKTP